MIPIETDPEGPVGPMGSGGRRRKPSGGAQAITMILAWVGGAAAAIAVAFWILQFVKPEPEPEGGDRPAIAKKDDRKSKPPAPVKQKVVKPQRKSAPVDPKKAAVPVTDLKNFQSPKLPGLRYTYYDGESFGMSDFQTASPSRSGLLVDIQNLPNANESKGLKLGGFWETKTEQPCEFIMDSTNGARLWVDEQLVLDNTANFQRKPVKASRTIQPGVHEIWVEFVLSTAGGSYKLEVGGAGDPKRMNLAKLLEPFSSQGETKAIDHLEYELAKSPKPIAEVMSLMAMNRKSVEAGFVENVPTAPTIVEEAVETVLPDDGRLLAGMAISPSGGEVSGLMPIYLTESGRFFGELIGSKAGQWKAVVAKPGFAVSAIQLGQSDSAKGVSLEFRRIGNESLLPIDAYTQSLIGEPVSIAVSDDCQPVVGMRVHTSTDSRLLGVEAIHVLSSGERTLMVLADGFPAPSGLKEAPSSSVATKGMKKLMKQSAAHLAGKTGDAQLMELKALAGSTANNARNSASDESRFIGLLEARRLHLLAGEFKAAFAIVDELSQEFEYDYWEDQLAFFMDAVKRAGSNPALKRNVVAELGPEILKAEANFEFEVAGKLAAGGKRIATELRDQSLFGKFNVQLEDLERSAKAAKQARVAAKTLLESPDDAKANRVMGIFSLVVTQDWDEAMKYFARSSNQDWEFIAAHDRSFDGADAEIAMKLADCWKGVGKKNEVLEKLAAERALKVLMEAKERAQGKALKQIEAELERL